MIEGGSQNVSRIPGQYAYPVQRYQSAAISPVGAVRAHPAALEHAMAARSGDALTRTRETYPRRELFRPDLYEVKTRTKAPESGPRAAAPQMREQARMLAEELEQSRSSESSYANSVFRARSDVTRGLFLNVLG